MQIRANENDSSADSKLIIDAIPTMAWSVRPDGAVDFVNRRWLDYTGLSLEKELEEPTGVVHPEDLQRVMDKWLVDMAAGEQSEDEMRLRRADGNYRWFLVRTAPMRDEDGNIVKWYGTSTEIEDRKRAEDELRQSERRWRAIFENTSVGVALLDANLHFLAVNAAFETMVGYRSDELQPLTSMELTHEEDRLSYKLLIDELLEGKRERFEIENRYRQKSGNALWVRINGSIVAGTNGNSRLWVVIVQDITERKRLRDQLQRERDRLRLLLDLNQKFVSKLEIRDFFSALATSLREVEGWLYSAILLPDPESRHLQIYLGGQGTLKKGARIRIEDTISGEAYRSGQPVLFRFEDLPPAPPDYVKLTLWRDLAKAEGLEVGCVVPLLRDGRAIGVLGLATRNDLESARADLPYLQELAKLVASALYNAFLYGELSESHDRLVSEKSYIEDQIRTEFGFEAIVGSSKGVRQVLQQVEAVAPTDSTVLIRGETGTGKELVARAIHDRSLRHSRSFIKVDCSTIPGALMESELFGYEKGAFTGAVTQKLGRVEAADGGTLFLDEVGDLPLQLQTKLLRVLQDKAFERLGSNGTKRIDVRIVAATNRNLKSMIEKGEFREDLYYRLQVFPIVIPPLRELPEDIPLLVRHYVAKYAKRMRKHIDTIPAKAMRVFVSYAWPGNIRELQHFMERSVVLTSGDVLQAPLRELEEVIQDRSTKSVTLVQTMEEIERESILQALRASNWRVGGPQGAAAKLGLKRTTLASRMERLNISRRPG